MGHCWTKLLRHDDGQSHDVHLASGNVHLITTSESWEEKLSVARRVGKIVVLNFSTSWCNPCKMIARAYCELADKYTNLIFLTVDIDELPDIGTSWDIELTPTFFFVKDGQLVDKLVGANKAELQKKVAAITDSATGSRN